MAGSHSPLGLAWDALLRQPLYHCCAHHALLALLGVFPWGRKSSRLPHWSDSNLDVALSEEKRTRQFPWLTIPMGFWKFSRQALQINGVIELLVALVVFSSSN